MLAFTTFPLLPRVSGLLLFALGWCLEYRDGRMVPAKGGGFDGLNVPMDGWRENEMEGRKLM
jgi:hypothetical protein